MILKNKILFIFFILIGFQSCYYDVEEELYPKIGGCDTANATLSGKIRPILDGSCYSCHGYPNIQTLGGNINLQNHATLKEQVDNGKLLKSINHQSGASAMPKGSTTKIDACEIKIIETWVAKGALDN